MTNHDQMLTAFKLLDEKVEWEERGFQYRLVWSDDHWFVYGQRSSDMLWNPPWGMITSHEACCLLCNAMLERLRERYNQVDVIYKIAEVVIRLYGKHGCVRYTAPTYLEALIAAMEAQSE